MGLLIKYWSAPLVAGTENGTHNVTRNFSQVPSNGSGNPPLDYFFENKDDVLSGRWVGWVKNDARYVPNDNNPALRNEPGFFRWSTLETLGAHTMSFFFMVPETTNFLPNDMIFLQWHSGGSGDYASPPFGIYFANGRIKIRLRRGGSPTRDNWMFFDLGPIVKGQWYKMKWFIELVNDPAVARFTFWLNDKLARLHHPTTGEPWVVPTTFNNTSLDTWIATSAKGVLPKTVDDGDGPVSVLDWIGFTGYDSGWDKNKKYLKCGTYRSGGYTIIDGKGVLQNSSDPNSPENDPTKDNYFDLEQHGYGKLSFYYTNLYVTNREGTDWENYRLLDEDATDPTEVFDEVTVNSITYPAFVTAPVSTEFLVNLIANPTEGGTATDLTNQSPYQENDIVTVKGEPNEGFRFLRWEINGLEIEGAGEEYNYTVPASDSTLVAVFESTSTEPNNPSEKVRFRGKFQTEVF